MKTRRVRLDAQVRRACAVLTTWTGASRCTLRHLNLLVSLVHDCWLNVKTRLPPKSVFTSTGDAIHVAGHSCVHFKWANAPGKEWLDVDTIRR
jgi:hypothetical protein